MADPKGRTIIEPVRQEIVGGMMRRMGGGEGDEESGAIGMDVLGFLRETPLLSILHFQEGALPQSPEEIVDGLLAQVQGG